MKSVTAAQMREADRRCIEELGIPGVVLMSNAGAAVFQEVSKGPVGVVCGKGNNGGDGFVVARLSLLAGLDTHVLLVSESGTVSADSALFMHAYRRLGGSIRLARRPDDAANAVAEMRDCGVLVDALLGTGIQGKVRDMQRSAIEAWPEVATIAVDVPSGLDADTGEIGGCCVHADCTVTFQFAKYGFETPTAQAYLGRLVVADIGIPSVCADDAAWEALSARW